MRALLLVLLALAAAATAQNATIYISQSSSAVDQLNCGNSSAPCASVGYGIARACSLGGAEVVVEPGSYPFEMNGTVPDCSFILTGSAGSSNTTLVFQTDASFRTPGGTVTLRGFQLASNRSDDPYLLSLSSYESVILSDLLLRGTSVALVSVSNCSSLHMRQITVSQLQFSAVPVAVDNTPVVSVSEVMVVDSNAVDDRLVSILSVHGTSEPVYLDKWTILDSRSRMLDISRAIATNWTIRGSTGLLSSGELTLLQSTITNSSLSSFQSTVIDSCSFTGGEGLVAYGDLQIIDSRFLDVNGTAISADTQLSVSGCFFTNCNSAIAGGAIRASDSLTIRNTTFLRCTSLEHGGAVWAEADFDIQNCTFEECSAQLYGGAISQFRHSAAAPSTVDSCAFIECTATEGGAIWIQDGTLQLTSSEFQSNAASLLAGAIACVSCDLNVEECHFQSNIGYATAGGLALKGNAKGVFENTTFTGNLALEAGGALSVSGLSEVLLANCTFVDNSGKRGGAVLIEQVASLIAKSCEFHNNSVFNTGGGGAIFAQGSALVSVESSLFQENMAKKGGAVYAESEADLQIYKCNFHANLGTSGGAVWVGGSTRVEILTSNFSSNTATFLNGGALCTSDSSQVLVTYCEFNANQAKNGGALSVEGNSDLTVSKATFQNNTCDGSGGALYMTTYAYLEIGGSHLTGNTANYGGGGFGTTVANYKMTGNTFDGNYAPYGGAMLTGSSPHTTFLVTTCHFQNNSAVKGGAIFFESYKAAKTADREMGSTRDQFTICDFEGNSAEHGGGVYFEDLTAQVPNFGEYVTFSGNHALFGGAVSILRISETPAVFSAVDFRANTAHWAGSTFGVTVVPDWGSLYDTPRALCPNCTYVNNSSPGYDSPSGWASTPKRLAGIGHLNAGADGDTQLFCGDTYPVDGSPNYMEGYLEDGFGNRVEGSILEEYPIVIDVQYYRSTGWQEWGWGDDVPPDNGTVTIRKTVCGPSSDKPATMKMLCWECGDIPLVVGKIEDLDCPFFLKGCSISAQNPLPGWFASDSDCPKCGRLKLGLSITAILVILVPCILLFLIFVLVSYRRMRRKIYEDMEIPDFAARAFSLQDLLEDSNVKQLHWEDIEEGEVLAQGAAGVVRKGIWKGRTPVAIKELILGIADLQSAEFADFLKEIVVMSALSDQYIIQVFGMAVPPDESRLFLVTELMERGSVSDLLKVKGDNLPWTLRQKMALDAAKGVLHLHRKNIIHRDLKTGNLLVNKAWDCKVADFGISTLTATEDRRRTCIGTPTHMAPEVLNRECYSEKADVFSFGIVLFEIFSGRRAYSQAPYATMNVALLNDAVLRGARPDTDMLPGLLRELVEDCWTQKPALRPDFAEIVKRLKGLPTPTKSF